MKRSLILGSLATVTILLMPALSHADTMTGLSGPSVADVLINRDVVNNNDDAVGTIDSVSLNAAGRVDYVVVDVSSWVGAQKLISIPWRDLSVDSDGNVRTTLTKEAVKKSADAAKTTLRPGKALPGDAISGNDMPGNAMSEIGDVYRAKPVVFENRPD
jgi:hypothetical protein